ncbi:MAG: PBP1A family penicillin-binding protein [Desulfobacterales bacterium]|jgi:penicillin-binding protein 1A
MIRLLRSVFFGLLAGLGLMAIAGLVLFFVAAHHLPRVPDPLSRIIETPPTTLYASTGERLMVIGGRETIPIDRVSRDFINAVVATEDHRFWNHHGINKLRTLKALQITLFEPNKIQGASTITQQLAKNLFFSFRRSYMRKVRELLVALQIESRFSKKEILEAYINQIPFGSRAHGIEQAARTFFDRSAADLTLAQSALLAGLPKSPTRYNPFRFPERARQRQRIVLQRMVATGTISKTEALAAASEPIELRPPSSRFSTANYFLDMVIRDLENRYGADTVHHGGLQVFTTLDPQLQLWATDAVSKGLDNLDDILGIDSNAEPDNRPQGALVAIEPRSGAVKAMIGGRDYTTSAYNRAIQSQRQAGSGFKPFVYYAAMERQGLTPGTIMVDKPVTISVSGARDWSPRNFSRSYRGPMVLKMALMKSVNTIAAQLVELTGPEAVIDTARRCGIDSPLREVFSVALGTSGVSTMEMASAFSTFANGGTRHAPYWIARVEDPMGGILEEHIVRGKRTLSPSISYQVLDMMRGVVEEGSGSVIRRLGFELPAAGKTGTTNSYKDAWFTGFTPSLCTSVWVGFDREKSLRDTSGIGITGGRGAAPIWADFMKRATEGDPFREFPIPDDIRFEMVDPLTGRALDALTRNPIRVALMAEQRPGGTAVNPGDTVTLELPVAPPEPDAPQETFREEDLPADG